MLCSKNNQAVLLIGKLWEGCHKRERQKERPEDERIRKRERERERDRKGPEELVMSLSDWARTQLMS
jgi:hypothetical protein